MKGNGQTRLFRNADADHLFVSQGHAFRNAKAFYNDKQGATMKLYYSPGACSLAPHIAACEAQLPVELVKVDLDTKRTEAGDDFRLLNPDGYVPLLLLDDGSKLTEVSAIVQYLADQAPENLRRVPLRAIKCSNG